jgi:hypothetical protein
MSSIIYIKAFNNLLDQFIDFLMETFPDHRSDITLTKTCTEFIRKTNPRTVVEQFMQFINPYEREIGNCNESFFLDFERNMRLQQDEVLFGLKLKSIWQSEDMTDYRKAKIWLFFQKLLSAGKKVTG